MEIAFCFLFLLNCLIFDVFNNILKVLFLISIAIMCNSYTIKFSVYTIINQNLFSFFLEKKDFFILSVISIKLSLKNNINYGY